MDALDFERNIIREAYVRGALSVDSSAQDEEILRDRFDLWFAREIASAVEGERRAVKEMSF